ncbi:MAG: GTP-binding protein [Aphanocapsa sp. GSE-SYN-MK-11-07L]|nr:GTP-binding protein [Aphanocapsa sp. GSE-SYN-MK-11-07L]
MTAQPPPVPEPALDFAVPQGVARSVQYSDQTRTSLQQLLEWHQQHHSQFQGELQSQLEELERLNSQLKRGLVQIVGFGLVSRGKSAVLNALCGEKVFPTGALHGVTQWPRSYRWLGSPDLEVELIDTPGLEEVDGQLRAEMAKAITQEADLILFIMAGEPTPVDIAILLEIYKLEKPVIVVVNKIDLFPDLTPIAIYQQLDRPLIKQRLQPEDIVLTAAAPAPVQVRLEWPNGRTSYRWETPPPEIESLQQKLQQMIAQDGELLLATRVLVQAQAIEQAIAIQISQISAEPAQALIWNFLRLKSVAVAISPFGAADLWVGLIIDLLLVRALSKLYGLPITRHQASKLWQTLLSSTIALLLSLFGSGIINGDGSGLTGFVGGAIAQAALAGYGAYTVGRSAQAFLVNGATWGPLGPSTLLQAILDNLPPHSLLYRLRQQLHQHLYPPD